MHTYNHEDFNRTTFARPVVLNLDQTGDGVVSSDLFGCNLEHTRADIFKGLSAQMLRNRKFAGRQSEKKYGNRIVCMCIGD